jgi:hypothetical protein
MKKRIISNPASKAPRIISIFISAMLNIPWIVEQIQKRRKIQEIEQQAQFVQPTASTNLSTSPVGPAQLSSKPTKKQKKRRQLPR